MRALWIGILAGMTCAQAQSSRNEKIKGLDSIKSPGMRERLSVRIREFSIAYRERDWGRVYAQLSDYPPPEPKERFIAEMRREFQTPPNARYLAFDPKELKAVDVELSVPQWNVFGCLEETDDRGKTKHFLGFTVATWEKGDWYFSPMGELAPMHAHVGMKCVH